ncbi:hypothetical protein AVEN_61187-1 [Araneus ventricosus]|uniref:Histone-lysine N-methyltransferase SETMAR n=1 Tax=Araneus ventricosus TaxID=182803 RepID=A0A4Y2QZ74_ARAVE|nr:hypothetical protein AVEN_61187-1 [Araneus ventricosus]
MEIAGRNTCTINANRYWETLRKLRRAIQNRRRGMLYGGIVLLHDNARPHTAAATQELLDQFGLFLKMDACPRNSLSSSAWQATGPGIAKNLRDALELASDSSVICDQQAPKKLTTEAVYMTFVLLAFVVFALIGSSIDAYENFRKAPAKKKLSDVPKKRPLIGVPSSKDEKLLAETSGMT